ncbi:hypothetical protein MBLNU459_g5202t2 [Dothideomycetes sp. NU459]
MIPARWIGGAALPRLSDFPSQSSSLPSSRVRSPSLAADGPLPQSTRADLQSSIPMSGQYGLLQEKNARLRVRPIARGHRLLLAQGRQQRRLVPDRPRLQDHALPHPRSIIQRRQLHALRQGKFRILSRRESENRRQDPLVEFHRLVPPAPTRLRLVQDAHRLQALGVHVLMLRQRETRRFPQDPGQQRCPLLLTQEELLSLVVVASKETTLHAIILLAETSKARGAVEVTARCNGVGVEVENSISSSATYPRTTRFAPNGAPIPDAPRAGAASVGYDRKPSNSYLNDLPRIIEGGQKAPSLYDHSRLDKLEEEAERLRRAIDDKQLRKRKGLREWERLERESEAAGLRAQLADESVRALAGESDGGAAF